MNPPAATLPKLRWVGLGLSVGLLLLILGQPLLLQRLDGWLYDWMLRRVQTSAATGAVVVVAIDDLSLGTLGRWPWPRDTLAQLLEQILTHKPAAVGLDLLLAEAGPCAVQCARPGLALPDHDAHLAQRLRQQPVVLGYNFDFDQPLPPCLLPPGRIAWRGENLTSTLLTARSAICPLPLLAQAAPQGGFLNAVTDSDGLLRRLPLVVNYQSTAYPALALAVLQQAQQNPPLLLQGQAGQLQGVQLGRQFVPTDAQGQVLLHYRAPDQIPRYSAAALLKGQVPVAALQGKLVLLGLTAAGLKDSHTTPTSNLMPGVVIHATLVDNLLQGDTWYSPAWGPWLSRLLGLLTGGLLTFWLTRASLHLGGLLASIVLPLGLGGLSLGLLAYASLWLSPLPALLTGGLCLATLLGLNFWHSESKRRQLYQTFAHYVSPSVIQELTRAEQLPTLRGEDYEVSLLFSDIRGFTNLSEQLSAQQLSEILNRYFTPMTQIVLDHQGTFDKYIGDALMAFWNAPLPVPQHPLQAVRAALAMLDVLPVLNVELSRTYGHTLRIGIAVHTGSARVGNMGSAALFDYTALGANVNLASRMVSLTRYYGVALLVSETVVPALEEDYYCLEIDRVQVRGLRRVITLYTPLSPHQATERHLELRSYEHARHFYKTGQFAVALRHYTHLAETYPERTLYATYLKRCQQLLANPPQEWDGVWDYQRWGS